MTVDFQLTIGEVLKPSGEYSFKASRVNAITLLLRDTLRGCHIDRCARYPDLLCVLEAWQVIPQEQGAYLFQA